MREMTLHGNSNHATLIGIPTSRGVTLNNEEYVKSVARHFVMCLMCIAPLITIAAKAQLTTPGPRVAVTDAPQILPASSNSDILATRALRKVIEASGGVDAWAQIHSAKVRLSITTPRAAKVQDFLMLDDWSTDAPIYRRGLVGSRRTPREHAGQKAFIASEVGKARSVPEFDQARVLAGSLPAAAAQIILRRRAYLAKLGDGARCTPDVFCIDIYRQVAPNGIFVREEEWLVSKSTSLPIVVDLRLPNLTGIRPIYEEFQFDQMLTTGGVSIPGKIEMRHPSGSTQIRSVTSFLPNAPFDTAAFDKEVTQ